MIKKISNYIVKINFYLLYVFFRMILLLLILIGISWNFLLLNIGKIFFLCLIIVILTIAVIAEIKIENNKDKMTNIDVKVIYLLSCLITILLIIFVLILIF